MRCPLVLVALAACDGGNATGTGIVAYSRQVTLDLAVVDVASGETTILDQGAHGGISISPDRSWIATSGLDRPISLFAADGSARREVTPGEKGCLSTPRWHAGHVIDWCTSDITGTGTYVLPGLDAASPRRLAANGIQVAPDGRQLAYLRRYQPGGPSPRGDLVVEGIDGSGARTFATDVDAYPIRFTDDGRFLIAQHQVDDFTTRLLRYAIADGSTLELSPGSSPVMTVGGPELLLLVGRELHAVEVESGAHRIVATLPPGVGIYQAQLVDHDRVVYIQRRDFSRGDIGMFADSIHLADAASDITLVPEGGTNEQCDLAGIAREVGFVAASCGGARLVAFDGTELASEANAHAVLGLSTDERGVVTVARDGTIRYLPADGAPRELGIAESLFEPSSRGPEVFEPLVAYAP